MHQEKIIIRYFFKQRTPDCRVTLLSVALTAPRVLYFRPAKRVERGDRAKILFITYGDNKWM